jgi:hypothetical protein
MKTGSAVLRISGGGEVGMNAFPADGAALMHLCQLTHVRLESPGNSGEVMVCCCLSHRFGIKYRPEPMVYSSCRVKGVRHE